MAAAAVLWQYSCNYAMATAGTLWQLCYAIAASYTNIVVIEKMTLLIIGHDKQQ